MRYNVFHGEKVSALGFGCMRLPVLDNDQSKIDMPKVEEMLLYAYEHGVNYFDTAYPYHNGFSEIALGEILARNGIRDKVNIATKLFTLEIGKPGFSPEKMLATQLERLKTDHIDYYLIHGVHGDQWERLKSDYNIIEFLAEKRRQGVIRHMGFSFHDSYEAFVKLIDDYDWEFAQIQYNYLDHEIQAGDRGLAYAKSKGIPLNIMEPLKGGNLIFPDYPAIEAIRAKHGITESNAELGLRYVYDKENLHVVLSGMNELAQVKENIAVTDRCGVGCLTAAETACIEDIRAFLETVDTIPCTGCRYCTEGCPQKIMIPMAFSCYNTGVKFGNRDAQRRNYDRACANIADCVECGQCAEACPQHLEVPELLKKVRAYFE